MRDYPQTIYRQIDGRDSQHNISWIFWTDTSAVVSNLLSVVIVDDLSILFSACQVTYIQIFQSLTSTAGAYTELGASYGVKLLFDSMEYVFVGKRSISMLLRCTYFD
jgi:hypothetical protein